VLLLKEHPQLCWGCLGSPGTQEAPGQGAFPLSLHWDHTAQVAGSFVLTVLQRTLSAKLWSLLSSFVLEKQTLLSSWAHEKRVEWGDGK
jgi:hypothetical protein